MATEKKYRWDTPQEWLLEKAERHAKNNDSAELLSIIQTLVIGLDADSIQDDFQSEMDADGYFKPEEDYVNTHDWDEKQGMCLKCGATDTSEG